MTDRVLFFRDFDELEPGVALATRGRTVTETDVVMFGSLTGDQHPLHMDAQWAAEGPFGERIAHGLLILGYAAGLIHFDPDCVVALRRIDQVVFKNPVRFGDTISVKMSVEGLRPVDDRVGLVETAWVITNQDGALVARLKATLLWRRGGG
jgi:acyl dehydratase